MTIKTNQNMIISPGQVTLSDLENIYRSGLAVRIDPSFQAVIDDNAARVQQAAMAETAIYGINTGFGKLAHIKIPKDDTATLQRNLILSHCCGVGAPLEDSIVRLVIVLKMLSLGRGASGVRWDLLELLQSMLEKGVMPVIPEKGSVGASGDLAPLAHLAAVMIGEGEAVYKAKRMRGGDALKQAGLRPVVLGAKEGLAMINGTQVSTALALAGLFRAWNSMQSALVTGALSTDAAMGSSAPFHPEIHSLRGQLGQIEAAAALRTLIDGSDIRNSHLDDDTRVQDPYCIRCQPQVMGAVIDMLRQAGTILQREANAVTDNPLILSDGSIVSGGNFHAEPVAFAADMIALALAETGSIAQRRIALMVDPALNYGLPAFLSPEPGLHSGLMIAEVSSAALMSENKQKAAPASIDSIPTSANQEDHVSMATHAARRLLEMADNLDMIIGIEAISATQGIDFRAPLKTSATLQGAIDILRGVVPAIAEDRYLAPDLESAAALVRFGTLKNAAGEGVLPALSDS